MALASATITYDISDLIGMDFDPRRTKVWVSTNIPNGVVVDTVGNSIRAGDGLGAIAEDGTGAVTVWIPGTGSNPASWQTYIYIDYAQRRPGGARVQQPFGPFTLTGDADLADLIAEQEVPPTYLSTITGQLEGYVDDAETAAAEATASAATAHDISNIDTPDELVAVLVSDPESDTTAALYPVVDQRIADAVLTDIPGGTGFILTTSEDGYPTIVATLEDPPDVPTVPLTLNAAPSFGQVALTWATPTSDGGAAITDYRIQYKLSASSSWLTWAHAASVATAATITGLANGSSYDFRVSAINFSGSSPYATVTNIAPGAVNGVVASDTFTRTAAEIVGTSPTVGLHTWSGATGAMAVNGSRGVAFSATPATGIVILDTGAKGDVVLTATRGVSSIGEAATRNTRHYIKYVDSTNYIYLQIGVATSGTVTLTVVAKVANVDTTILTTGAWPANVIPASTALADYAISFSVIGTAVSATVNGTTRAGTLTGPQAAALADATRVAFTVASSTYQLDNLSVSVNGTYVA